MAIEKRGIHWFNTASLEYYSHEPVEIGDIIQYTGNRSSTYEKGEQAVVRSVSRGTSDYVYMSNEHHRGQNRYVYTQAIYVQGSDVKRSMKNWKKAEGKKMFALEEKKPVIVQEIEETIVDGKAVVKNIGEPLELTSLSEARIYTTNEITKSIREQNAYRQFRIYVQDSIARAKKPEIEFA